MEERRKKKSNVIKIAAIFGILFVPTLIFYLFIYTGVHHVRRLPFFGPRKVVETEYRGKLIKDTLYHEIPSFEFTSLDSQLIDSNFIRGHIYVAYFLDMDTFSSIPKQVIYTLSEALVADKEVRAITFLLHYNPETDTILKPSAYTDKLKDYDTSWVAVTGDAESIKHLWYDGYFAKGDHKVYEPYHAVLVDREGRIRAYYNPVLAEDIKRMKDEIAYLKKEYSLDYRTHRFFKYDDDKPEQKRD